MVQEAPGVIERRYEVHLAPREGTIKTSGPSSVALLFSRLIDLSSRLASSCHVRDTGGLTTSANDAFHKRTISESLGST